jgi:nickel-dependent lactate racemase
MVASDSILVKLPYGNAGVEFDVSKERLLGILAPRTVPSAKDPHSTVVEALRNPVDGQGLASGARKAGSVVIVTDDFTRPTPAGQICEAIMDELNSLGVADSCISILAGGGLHRPMTKDELKMKFGVALIERVKIASHNAWDDSQLQYIGRTSLGTPLWVNKLVVQADLRVLVGMITAHFLSGYASGPKTILPGVSGYRTIFHNHGVIAASHSARIGVTQGNPCWSDMVEALRFLGPTLAVDVVLNTNDELVAAFHGEPVSAQKAGLDLYHNIYAFDVKEKADIVIASANPMYSYLDQCLKAVIHSSMLVKDGGTRIVASPCEELLGPPFLRELYYQSLSAGWPSADEYARVIQSGKIKDMADAIGILKFLQTNQSTLTLVCDRSFEDDLTKLGFSHMPTVQAALDEATARIGHNSKVLVIPYGAVTHPIPERIT